MDAKRTTPTAVDRDSDSVSTPVAERVTDTVHETIDRLVESGHPALDHLAERAHETVGKVADVAGKAGDGVQAQAAHVKEVQHALVDDCREFVRAHPFKSLLYAAAAGFLVTRVLRD